MFIHRQSIEATTVDVGKYTEFEFLAVKLVGHRSASVIVVCVYKPPGMVLSQCTEQLSDMLDQFTLFDTSFVVIGDFDAPVLARYELLQHVVVSTLTLTATYLNLILSQTSKGNAKLLSTMSMPSLMRCLSTSAPRGEQLRN